MKTERLFLNDGFYEKSITRAVEILKNDGIVAVPTETVYGLAASAYSDDAIKKVFSAKGRPQDNPLIVHICDMEMLALVAKNIPKTALACAERFWPGPFTMVLEKKNSVAESVSAGLDTVAVRMPSDRVIRDIIKRGNLPIAAPSANISGAPSPTSCSHVLNDLDTKIDAVIMGGDCEVGVESTVISLVGDTPRLLRPGAVTAEELRAVLPDLVIDRAILSEPEKDAKVASPGMKYKHYAPKTEAYLIEGSSKAFADFVNRKSNPLAVCFDEDKPLLSVKNISYGSVSKPASFAKNVFGVLRRVDGENAEAVYIHAPEKKGVGLAVYNRLIRAAAFRVIKL